MIGLKMKGAVASLLTLSLSLAGATALVTISADPAFANNGNGNGNGGGNGNGRGNGNGNKNADRSERSNGNANNAGRGNNGRGAIASELKSLNAAHASPTALANASPNSMPGKLNSYREDRLALVEAVEEQNVAYAEFQRLSGLTDAEIATEFPNGGYEAALSDATNTYAGLRETALTAQMESSESLMVLTEGRELSDAALAELHDLLGL